MRTSRDSKFSFAMKLNFGLFSRPISIKICAGKYQIIMTDSDSLVVGLLTRIFEKSPTWWCSEGGVPRAPGYKKPRNERFRPRAFQKIKNY